MAAPPALAPLARLVLDIDELFDRGELQPLTDFDRACEQAGLVLQNRYRGWDGAEYVGESDGYAVSVHRLAP